MGCAVTRRSYLLAQQSPETISFTFPPSVGFALGRFCHGVRTVRHCEINVPWAQCPSCSVCRSVFRIVLRLLLQLICDISLLLKSLLFSTHF